MEPVTIPKGIGFLPILMNWLDTIFSNKEWQFNDQYQCGKEQGEMMRENLGGELIIKPGEGHFNLEKSPEYKQFPSLLNLIK